MSQPAPTPNDSRPVWELVIEDMQARDRVGRERYGVPLQAGNGRDALRDAYEEALDLAVYLRQAIAERDARRAGTPVPRPLFESAMLVLLPGYDEAVEAAYERIRAARLIDESTADTAERIVRQAAEGGVTGEGIAMLKRDEAFVLDSCWNKAKDDEMTFVLLGRDAAAPAAIRAWIAERIRLGKNQPDDPQIVEAERCARAMEASREPGRAT